MEIKTIKIKDLATNDGQIEGLPKNPRQIKDARFEALKKSITDAPEMLKLRELLVYPIDGGKFVVIGGNMRLRACKDLGYKSLPCKVLDADTPPEKLREYCIKDNENFGQYDWDLVANEWDTDEITGWGVELPLWEDDNKDDGNDGGTTDDIEDDNCDAEKETIVPRVAKGDIWKLGVHRLMCGDSTNAADVALLMDGKRADICFTSPPYNVMAEFANKHIKDESAYLKNDTYEEYSDDLTDEQYYEFLQNALNNALNNADDVMFNIGCCKGALYGTAKMIGANAEFFKGIIVWEKSGAFMPFFPAQYGLLGNIAEPIYCFSLSKKRKFAHPQWQKGEAVYNSVATANAAANEYNDVNAATFPIDLAAHFVKNFAAVSVLDLFGGTGTTLIAAEQLKKQCFMMELSAKECDIIIARWEKLTNGKAARIAQSQTV